MSGTAPSAARVLFSDIDGTLVHYLKHLNHLGTLHESPSGSNAFQYKDGPTVEAVLQLAPSLTGAVGYITRRSLELVKTFREGSPRSFFVVVSGARTSTVIQRLPWLPAADAVVTENGGRIFLRDPAGLAAAPYIEDFRWRAKHSDAAGPASQEKAKPEERAGPLWDAYRAMVAAGWAPDAGSYTTLVRVKRTQAGKNAEDWDRIRATFPASLQCADNLEYTDVFPKTSGKEAAVRYLSEHFGAALADCVAMGDDDNDLGMAASVGHMFVPGITAESMRRAVEAKPGSFTVAPVGGFLGTESSLEAVLKHYGK